MEMQRILDQIQDIFREILEEESLMLTHQTTAEDVEGWDSLTHIQLIVAIEEKLKIKFSSKEILSWKNVGELINSIDEKVSA